MRAEKSGEGRKVATVASKRAAEAAGKALRDARTAKVARALSHANRRTGLFKQA